MKHYLLSILLFLCAGILCAQNRDVVLSNIENYTITQLSNGMKIQVVKTSEFQHFTYRFSADVSMVGEGNLSGVKQVVADLTGCDYMPDDLIVKKMVSHDNALDSVFEFMADVFYNNKYSDFSQYKTNKLEYLEQNQESKFNIIAAQATGEKILTPESLQAIDNKAVEAYIKQCFSPDKCILTVVANVDAATVQESAKKFFGKAVKSSIKGQSDNKKAETGDFIYSIDGDFSENIIAYRCIFPFAKTAKNYAIGNVAYELMFLGQKDAIRRSSQKSECYSFETRTPIQGFDVFQTEFFAPRNPGFDYTEAGNKAKDIVVGEFDKMLLRPEYAAEIASHLLLYKLPKNYFTLYKQTVNAITANELLDFFSMMTNNGRSVMVVAGPRKPLHCQLFNAARYREVDFMNSSLEKERVIPKGFGAATIIDTYLEKTGLIDPPKHIMEEFTSKYTFKNGGNYDSRGRIYRKQPDMYRMENYVIYAPDTLIVHYVEMFNGEVGYDSTKLYGALRADSLRTRQLLQKAAFPIEKHYGRLNVTSNFACDYVLDSAGYYAVDVTDALGIPYRDYYSISEGTKDKTEILFRTGGVETEILFSYEKKEQYLLPKVITEKTPNYTIETTFNEYIIDVALEQKVFEPYEPAEEPKKKKRW